MNKFGNYVQVKLPVEEKTKEQEDAEVRESFLAFVRKFFDVKNVKPADLKAKILKMHIYMCKLEGEKYDLEKHLELQKDFIKEAKEKLRAYDPDFDDKRRSKVQVVKQYDRQVDRRNYSERRKIFEKGPELAENAKKLNGQMPNKTIFQRRVP